MVTLIMTFNFSEKKALVTGGSRGIGRDIVAGLAKANIAKVYVLGRDQNSLDKLKQEVSCVVPIRADVSDWNSTRTIVEAIEPLDFLINNAGMHEMRPFLETTEDDIDRTLNLNLKGVINVSQVVCKRMMERGGGVVVNVSSTASKRPFHNVLTYCVSKTALDAVTRQMALELAPKIRVNSVNPSLVLTDLGQKFMTKGVTLEAVTSRIPRQKLVECEDVTNAVLFLLSDAAAMIHGHALPVDGGFLAV